MLMHVVYAHTHGDQTNHYTLLQYFSLGGLGWDALVVQIHTQDIGDCPSKSTSGQKRAKDKVHE